MSARLLAVSAMIAMSAALLATSAAHAQPTDGIGVVVTGDATIQPQTEAQIEDWLRQRGHTLVAAPLRPDALTALLDCFVIEDLACAKKVFDTSATATQLVFAKVDLSDGSRGRAITLTAYWFQRGREPQAVRRACTACSDPTATLDEAMSSLAGKGRAAQGMFELTTTPSGARVTIDGKDVGRTPLTLPLAQGAHEVTVRHEKHEPTTTQIAITEGTPTRLDLALSARTSRGALPYLVAGAGTVLLATGVVLYATSEKDTGEKPEYRDTRAGGVALAAAGVVTLGVATWLFLRDRPADAGAPALSLAPGGATLGWTGAF